MNKGHFKLNTKDDNIYMAYTEGILSETMYENLINKSENLINKLNPNGYVMFIDARKFEGSTPKSYKMYDFHNKWINENSKLLAKAVVLSDSINVKIKISYLKYINQQNIKYFLDEKEAWNWLNQYI
jgi:hypothetical protein